MENLKTSFIYGIYGALLGFVFYFMLLLSGNSPWSSASWLGAWIPGVTAFLAIKKVFSLKIEPYIGFAENFLIALVAIFVQAVIYNVLVLFVGNIIDTGAIDMYQSEVVTYAKDMKDLFGEELYDKMLEEIKKTNLSSLAFGDFIYKIMGGVIVSLILATTLKKKPLTNE